MSLVSTKKWSSFEEMYNDLKKDDRFKGQVKTSTEDAIINLIKKIEEAVSGKDFFDCTCILSSLFENLEEDVKNKIYHDSNVYVMVLNAVLRNTKFVNVLSETFLENKNINDLMKDQKDLEKLIFLNTALSLAFFGISINYKSINKTSIEFLRKNVSDLLRNILRSQGSESGNFSSLCFFLEKIIWDNGLHYNENFTSKFPVKLDSVFLFNNLKTSRAFGGIMFTSLAIRIAIENRFKKIISNFSDEKFSISFSLFSIFNIANELDEKINHYYRNSNQDISSFFDIFIKNNEKNLIYCLKSFCTGFQYQGKEKKFFEVILDKLETTSSLKDDFVNYTKKNFRAFNQNIGDEDDQWTNKLFLISIKTLSVLEQVKDASDSRWVVSVAVHEFRQWLVEIHEVLNKYHIEDDWEKVESYVKQENETIEWKSSFYVPMEQEYTDETSDTGISKKLFGKILKVTLAMLNTDGGCLIVGLVEKPEAIKRIEIKEFIIKKNGLTFFDINYELKKFGKTLDDVRLHLLDNLKQITDTSPDEFNNLIEFEPIFLRDESRVISIVRILIKKANKPFFNVKKEGNLVWLSLTKRAQGQNVDVDIRNHLGQ